MQIRSLVAGAAALFSVIAAQPATAALFQFDIESSCLNNCDVIGLNSGDAVGGFFILDTDTLSSGFNIGDPALEDFSLTFGNIAIDDSSAVASTLFFTFDDATNVISDFGFFASEALSPDSGEGFGIHGGSIPFSQLSVGPETRCDNASCGVFFNGGTTADLAVFNSNITGVPVSTIPLPAAVWLFLGGLGGLGMIRRRAVSAQIIGRFPLVAR